MKKRTKKYLAVMALSILATGMKPDRIMAQELAETMEQEKEDISTAEQVENGIVVLENQGNFGSVDLIYTDNHYTIKCDYSEYEIPMGALCRLEIHPLLGYQVDFVKVNQNPISLENEVYEILMQESFTEISIGYAQTEEMQSSTVNETFQDNRIPDSGKNSVSAVSHEVKVIYLNTEEKTNEEKINVIPEENTVEETENVVAQTEETEGVEENLAEGMPANEEARDFEEENQESTDEEPAKEELTEKKQNILETESRKTEDKKPVILEKEDKAEEETEMQESVETKASDSAPGNEQKFSKITENETCQIKKKSFLNISNFPLYLMIICCILLVRYKKMDKKGRGING